MPYPPAKTFQATTPGTALDPQRNAIAGGVGNAHTIMGTTPGNTSASAMKPYDVQSPVDITLSGTTDAGREIIGTSYSPVSAMSIIDADGNGTGRDAGDTIIGASFPNVAFSGSCSAATLYFEITSTTTAGNIRVKGQGGATAHQQFANTTYMPSAQALTTATATMTNAVGSPRSVNVTSIVNEILAGAGWASGNRMNFILDPSGASSNCAVSNEAVGFWRLTITP